MSTPAPPSKLAAVAVSSLLSAPTITTVSLPAATLGQLYTGTVTATGGLPPYTWRINSGTLPPGLALQVLLSKSVSISGVPTATGSFTFSLLCTDALQQSTQIIMTMEHPQ